MTAVVYACVPPQMAVMVALDGAAPFELVVAKPNDRHSRVDAITVTGGAVMCHLGKPSDRPVPRVRALHGPVVAYVWVPRGAACITNDLVTEPGP